jgi:hypothetical protein
MERSDESNEGRHDRRHTDFDKGVVGVAPEKSVGEKGDYGIDWGHVQYSETVG